MEGNVENWKTSGITEAQRKKLFSLLSEHKIDKDIFEGTVEKKISEMSKGDASECIDILINAEDKIGSLRLWSLGNENDSQEEQKQEQKSTTANVPATKEEAIARKQEVQKSNAVQVYPGWNREQVELIKRNFAYGATDGELALFFEIARIRKLNPLLGEIKWVRRRKWDKELKKWVETATIIIGIDGGRRKAEESNRLDGISVKVLRDDSGNIAYGAATLWLKGSTHPVYAEVPFAEYAAKDRDGNIQSNWKTMPETMIKKVAEFTAYRMAFAAELGGMYIEEEMQQAGTPIAQPVTDVE